MNDVNCSKIKSWDFTPARYIDLLLLVAIGFSAIFLISAKRTGSLQTALILALLFSLFLFIMAYSVASRRRNKRMNALYDTAYRLWLQNIIVSNDLRRYANFIADILYSQGFHFAAQSGKVFTARKNGKDYLVIPLRRHPSHKITAQEILSVCDESLKGGHPDNILIAASCVYDADACDFVENYSSYKIQCFDMQDICSFAKDSGYTASIKDIDAWMPKAKAMLQETGKRAGFAKRMPQLRYLLCSLMLLAAAYFMPFKTWYIILSGISMGLFLMTLLFPSIKRRKQEIKQYKAG
mgnify:CR=1 FL=1